MSLKTRRLVIAVSSLALCLSAVNGTPASAEETDLDPSIATAQEPLDNAVDQVEAEVAGNPQWAAQYGGSEMNVATKTVVFRWKGSGLAPVDFILYVDS